MTSRPPGLARAGAGAAGPFTLESSDRATLSQRLSDAARRARRERRPVLAALTVSVPASLDLSAAVLGSRRPTDSYFCFEQPERGGFVLAGLGEAAVSRAGGSDRFRVVARSCRELAAGAFYDDASPGATPAGPVWVGGFAFAPNGGATPEWGSLDPARLVLPEVCLASADGQARLTLSAVLDASEDPRSAEERLLERLGSLRTCDMPLLDPDLVARPRVAGAMPPSHYEGAVSRAVERIRAGELSKVVLAREVRVHASAPIDPAPVFDGLRTGFPSCYCYLVGTPELAFTGASPELLVRRDGARAQTVALAGTTGRSADPAVDDHLGERLMASDKNREEQAIVARRIERALEPLSVWVGAAEAPVLIKVQNVQHLATPIRAQLREPVSAIELAGVLHPTPAVGGEPWERAAELIPALEGLDRGWYAGPVGWTDLAEDGEFCVALRCALLRGPVAHLYAGDGIVADSVPAEELAETEVKLQALLPLLT